MTKEQIIQKLTSRKFWMGVAAFLASLYTTFKGIQSDSEVVTVAGIICSSLSAAIYAALEASVDKSRLETPYDHASGSNEVPK